MALYMFHVLTVKNCVSHWSLLPYSMMDWYLNFNRCSRKQHPLKLLVRQSFKTEITWQFWESHSFLTRGDKALSVTYLSVNLNLDLPLIFMVKYRAVLKWSKFTFFCIDLCVVCTLTTVSNTCWVVVNALQHGLVLNRPLQSSLKTKYQGDVANSAFLIKVCGTLHRYRCYNADFSIIQKQWSFPLKIVLK